MVLLASSPGPCRLRASSVSAIKRCRSGDERVTPQFQLLILKVLAFMWLRTAMNYQKHFRTYIVEVRWYEPILCCACDAGYRYKFGGTLPDVLQKLYREGGHFVASVTSSRPMSFRLSRLLFAYPGLRNRQTVSRPLALGNISGTTFSLW